MIKLNRTVSMLAFSATLLALPLISSAMEREGRMTQIERMERDRASAPEIVKWVGTIKDDADSHPAEHELAFTRKDNGATYDIVDSPELVKLHHDTEKNYVVEIEAEKTSKFLFWGGNLIVKNFRVIGSLTTLRLQSVLRLDLVTQDVTDSKASS